MEYQINRNCIGKFNEQEKSSRDGEWKKNRLLMSIAYVKIFCKKNAWKIREKNLEYAFISSNIINQYKFYEKDNISTDVLWHCATVTQQYWTTLRINENIQHIIIPLIYSKKVEKIN